MTGGFLIWRSGNPVSDARMAPHWFQIVRFRDNSRTSPWSFATWCLFMLCRFHLSWFNMHSQRNWINSFGKDWRKRLLDLWETDWNTWGVERFCAFIFQIFWLFQPVREIRTLTEFNRCLYKNVIDRLCVATNRTTNDQREHTLQLDTSQLVLNQNPTVC